MKLHLPTRLRAAVLACITAVAALAGTVGTGTITTGVVAYTMSLQQAQAETTYNGVTYSGHILNIATTDSATFHDRNFSDFYQNGEGTWVNGKEFGGAQNTYYYGADTTGTNAGTNTWNYFFGAGNGKYSTLRLTGATKDVYLEAQFSPFTLGGLIAEAGASTYTIGRKGGGCGITIQAENGQQANLTIAADTRLSSGVNAKENQHTIFINSGGTWNIAAGKALTMAQIDGNGVVSAVPGGIHLAAQQAVTITGGGAANLYGATTLNQGSSITLTGASALNITGALSLDLAGAAAGATPIINGAGSLVSATGLTLNNYEELEAGDYKLISTTSAAADALAALFTSSAKYTVSNKDGVVTLTVAASADLVWNGGNGVWDDSTSNWLEQSTAASFDDYDFVTFATEGARVTIQGDKEPSKVKVNASTEWLGTAVVTTRTLEGTSTLSLGSDVTLKVLESASGVTLAGSGTYVLPPASPTLGVALADTWNGTVALNRGSNTVLNINGFNLNTYGHGNSTVELTAMSGYWLDQDITFTPNLLLLNSPDGTKAALTLNNGYRARTYTFAGNISGSGNLAVEMPDNSGNPPAQKFVFTGDLSGWTGKLVRTKWADLSLTFNGQSGNTGLSSVELAGNGRTTTFAGDSDVTIGQLLLQGSNLAVNTNLTVTGQIKLADHSNAAGKTVTIAAGKTLTADSMLNDWGAVVSLGENSTFLVKNVATIATGQTQRVWTGAGESSVFRVGGLSGSNHANTVFRNMTVAIGASGITQAGDSGRFVFDDATILAEADWTETSPNAGISKLELVNGVTLNTGEHQVVINSAVAGEGSLTKTGTGTLELAGTNEFSGAITISEGALVLHNTLSSSSLVNNGSLVIASGFAGLDASGTTGVAGATAGNGFANGGSAHIFTTEGTLTGTMTATYGGKEVTFSADGTATLDVDWTNYRVNASRSETETIAAIKSMAEDHGSALQTIIFADGVDAAMDTMEVNGFDVQLGNTAHTIGTLNITNGTVTSSCAGANGVAFTSGPVNINEGGKLVLTGSDAFSWCSSPADSPVILLAGAEGNTAVLQLDQRMTYGKGEGENGSVISLNGYSHVTGEGGLDPVGDMNNPATVNVAAGTTNNVFDATVYKRSLMVFNVGEGAELTIGSTFTDSPSGNTTVGHVTKAGAGTATITKDNIFHGLNLAQGTLVIDGADVLVTRTGGNANNGSELNLWEGATATGVLKLVNEANLKVDTNSSMWFHDGTSVLIEKESSFTKLASNYSLEIKAAGETEGKMIAKAGASWYYQNLASDIFYVEDAAVSISSTADANVGLKMNGASTFTNTGSTTLTLTNAATTALAAVNAQGGNIALGSVANVGAMDIAAGKTVSTANALSISNSLTAGAGSTLSAAVTLGNGAALDLVTGNNALNLGDHAVTLGTGLVISETMMNSITALAAETSLTLMQGVSSLTGGELDAKTVISGLTGDYTIKVQDGNLVVSAAAQPAAELSWLGGAGTWGEGTPWTNGGEASAYVEGAKVTIAGTEGGMIALSSPQTASSVTIAHSDYKLANESQADTLTITGDFTVNENVSTQLWNILPDVGGKFVVKSGATLDMSNLDMTETLLTTVLEKASGAGTVLIKGGAGVKFDKKIAQDAQLTVGSNLTVKGDIWLNGNYKNPTIKVTEGHTLTTEGVLNIGNSIKLVVDGGKLETQGGLAIGHTGGNYPAHLTLKSGTIETSYFKPLNDNNTNTITIEGGDLIITGETAFVSSESAPKFGEKTTVTISNATLTNGTTDMAFNHGSTLTDATITAKGTTTISMGADIEGQQTVIAKAEGADAATLTTNGKVQIIGTTAISGATTVTSNGTLTIKSLTGTEGSALTTAGTGTTTIEAGSVDKIVANGTTTLGDVTVKNIAGTITQAASTTLTLADGATLDSAATIGAATAAGSLTKTGTATVTTGDITGTSTALAVNGGTLSTGAVSGLSTVTVAQGATLTSTGDVTATGNATINGSLTAGSLTAANITVAQGATVGATTGMSTAGTLTLNDSATLGSLSAGTVSLAADKTLTVTGAADITSLTLSSVSATPAVNLGSLTSTAMEVNVSIDTLHSYFEGATGNSVTIATLGASSATTLSLTNTQGGGYDYSIALDSSNNIVISRDYSGVVWQGGEGAQWGQGGSWQGGDVPETSDAVSFIGNQDTAVTPTVTIASDGVSAGSVSVTGSESVSADYTFTGGSLTATNLLIENGSLGIANESTFTSGSVKATGTLTVDGADAALELGTLTVEGELTVESGELTITDTLTTEAGATLAFNGGSSAITTAALGSDTIVIQAPASVLLGTVEGEETTVQLTGALNVVKGDIKKIEGISGSYGDLTVGTVQTGFALTPNVTTDVAIAEASDVNNLTVTGTGNLAAQNTLHVHGTAEVAENGVMTVAKDTTIDDTLTNKGDITIGSAAAPATLATGDVVNDGTITVFNTMTSTGDVTNMAGKTLDVKGSLTANTAGKTVSNEGTMTIGGTADVATLSTGDNATSTITGNATVATALTNAGSTTIGGTLTATNAAVTNEATGAGEKLTVTGALTANTLTTAAGATTEAKGGATLGSELANHGTTTVTGDLASADATAPITITNDATGAGEKLAVTGNVTAESLTTETGATTEIGGATTLSDTLTNAGTTTITGALTSADAAGTNPGTLSIANTGALSTGNLTADSLSGNGATTVTGNATLSKLDLGTTGSLTASGTAKVDSVSSTGGSVTADTLDLSGLTAAATIADVKADKITLSGFNMLKVTDSISNENGTGAAMVMLTLDADTMSTLSVGDEKVVVATDDSVAGQGITLGNLAAVNSALKSYGIKGAMVTTAEGALVMQVQDNSFVSQVATSENGIAGAEMVDAASAAGLATAGTALGDVYAALDACRTTGDAATGDRLAAAVTGSSIAAMGSALSGDVERQLRAIRNRTTTMGVNQSVINENMPYFNAWVNAEGDYRKVAADGTMAGYKMMSWGGTVGMDVDFTPSFTAGLAATAMYGDFDAESEDHATGNIDTYYVSAFARYAKHRWTHTFVATAGLAETSLDRTILGHTVSGDSDGVMFGGMYEVGYVFALDKDATTCLQPVFNVSYTHASLSGYDESGANIGLTAGDVELNKLTVGLGARLQSVVGENIYNRSSILEARALVKFDAGDRQGETDVTFAGTGLPTHTTKSSETGAVGAEFGVGLTVPVGAEGGNIFVDASAEIRAEYTNVNATVGYRVNF